MRAPTSIVKKPLRVPEGLSYLPYQESGIRYALGARGTIIADEMGLGKTVQAIGVINQTRSPTVVIICPAGLIHNWHRELSIWLCRDSHAVCNVISYHEAGLYAGAARFAAKPTQLDRDVEQNGDWDILIVDEAQYIKNPSSERSRAVTKIAEHCKRVLLLTGTPIEDRVVDLWPLLRIVAPAVWDPPHTRIGVISLEQKETHPGEGPNFWAFAKRYCGLKKRFFRGRRGRMGTSLDFSGATNLDELGKKLRQTCMVRRLKKDVLKDLPAKRRQLIVLRPDKRIDDSDLLLNLNEENYTEQIRKLIADKATFETYAKRRHEQALLKVDAALVHIRDVLDSARKIIVFAHHRDVMHKLFDGLTAEFDGDDYAVMVSGETHPADRAMYVGQFQEDSRCRVFLGSIGAAGVGITLTAASVEIFVELDPTPGKMNQAEDRAHRIGLKHMILVQHLVFDGSLCARIAQILIKKQDVITRTLDMEEGND